MRPQNKILRTKTRPARGSHLPVLMKLLSLTTGSILEVGCGMYSTCYLHWACYPTKRRLVTFETNPEYFPFLEQFESDFHEIHCVKDYGSADWSEPWSVAFVDNAPDERRRHDIVRLLHAEYVAAHDANNSLDSKYQYTRLYPLFKYRTKYSGANPATAIFSNFHDLTGFTV